VTVPSFGKMLFVLDCTSRIFEDGKVNW